MSNYVNLNCKSEQLLVTGFGVCTGDLSAAEANELIDDLVQDGHKDTILVIDESNDSTVYSGKAS